MAYNLSELPKEIQVEIAEIKASRRKLANVILNLMGMKGYRAKLIVGRFCKIMLPIKTGDMGLIEEWQEVSKEIIKWLVAVMLMLLIQMIGHSITT